MNQTVEVRKKEKNENYDNSRIQFISASTIKQIFTDIVLKGSKDKYKQNNEEEIMSNKNYLR